MADLVEFRPRWRDKLKLSATGAAKHCYFNARLAIEGAHGNRIAYDESAMEIRVVGPLPWDEKIYRPWGPQDDLEMLEWVQRMDILVGLPVVQTAVEAVAMRNRVHPIRDWLNSLTWDGQARIDDWLTYYCGAPRTEGTQAIGACWLISAVARVFDPGCKVDHVLILEGSQGMRKSEAFKALAQPWFSDELADLGDKDAAMQTRGVWVIEIAELDALLKSRSASTAKAFITRTVDRFRPPYGRRVVANARECVFAGTVNGDEYLVDETGGRRFWPVPVTAIDVDALKNDRDQIWAEAVARYRDGAQWWIEDEDLMKEIQAAQDARRDADPWEPLVLAWMHQNAAQEKVTTTEILTRALAKKDDELTPQDARRVNKILFRAGWRRASKKIAGRVIKAWKHE